MNKQLTRWQRVVRGAAIGVGSLTMLLLAAPAEAGVSIYFSAPYFYAPYRGYFPPPRYYSPRRFYPPPRYYRYRKFRDHGYRHYGYRHGYRGYWPRPHRGRGYQQRRRGPGRDHVRPGPRPHRDGRGGGRQRR